MTESEKSCFFITPIGGVKSEQFEKLEGLKANVMEPVLSGFGYELVIAHTIDKPGSINDQIFTSIVESELVIVNLTGLNPNVMYELAVRHSFGKPCIMICERNTSLPFDLLADRTIFFDDTIKGTGELIEELKKKIVALNESPDADNPVYRALKTSAVMTSPDSNTEPFKVVLNELHTLSNRIVEMEHFNKTNSVKVREVPSQKKISMKNISNIYHKLAIDLGRRPTAEEVAAEVGIPISIVRKIIENNLDIEEDLY